MTRRICVVTGTRAEYGLLRWVIDGFRSHPDFELQLIATGMHLSPEFGLTFRAIEEDGFDIDEKIEMLLSSDTPEGITKSMGLGLIGFADAFRRLAPDLLLVLGDRFEIYSATIAAMVARIPIAHLHGGEVTEGVIDESIRHSITKMSHYHFVATEDYRKRVIQLGESPDRVFNVGGLGLDSINKLQLLGRKELEESLQFDFRERNLMVTFHPVTLEEHSSAEQMSELLGALGELRESGIIFTLPNADADGRILHSMVKSFASKHQNCSVYTSLGQLNYLSCMQFVDAVVGNSSSGIIEAPGFKKGTINIGDRQLGRIQAASIINCQPEKASIINAIEKLYSPGFQNVLATVSNPYGNGGASEKIINILSTATFENILKKKFHDIPALCE